MIRSGRREPSRVSPPTCIAPASNHATIEPVDVATAAASDCVVADAEATSPPASERSRLVRTTTPGSIHAVRSTPANGWRAVSLQVVDDATPDPNRTMHPADVRSYATTQPDSRQTIDSIVASSGNATETTHRAARAHSSAP